jgi:hypothetical protein
VAWVESADHSAQLEKDIALLHGRRKTNAEAYKALAVQSPVKRPPWELLDQEQKETLTLIWFAGFLAGHAIPDSSS